MPGLRGIDPKQTYTDISAELRDQFSKKGKHAGIRFTDAKGLYVKNSQNDMKRNWMGQLKKRIKKFDDAGTQIREAINREYRDWDVGGEQMGDYVFRRLGLVHLVKRLDGNDLKKIDELIKQGVLEAAELKSNMEMFRMQDHRNKIFERLEQDPGDYENRIRAAGWSKIVEGSRLLRKAISADLQASRVGGDPDREAAFFMETEQLGQAGLTTATLMKTIGAMKTDGYSVANLLKLTDLINLERNITVNVDQLRDVNARIKTAIGRNGSILSSNDQQKLLNAIAENERILNDAEDFNDRGALDDLKTRNRLSQRLTGAFNEISRLRTQMAPNDALATSGVRQVTALLDKHAAATHDLALALLDKTSRDSLSARARAFHCPSHGIFTFKYFDTSPLSEDLHPPETLFSSKHAVRRSFNMLAELTKLYNRALHAVRLALDAVGTNPSAGNLHELSRRLDNANVLSDHIMRMIGGINRNRRKDRRSGHDAQTALVQSQRNVLQSLRVAATTVAAKQANQTHSLSANWKDNASASSSGNETQNLIDDHSAELGRYRTPQRPNLNDISTITQPVGTSLGSSGDNKASDDGFGNGLTFTKAHDRQDIIGFMRGASVTDSSDSGNFPTSRHDIGNNDFLQPSRNIPVNTNAYTGNAGFTPPTGGANNNISDKTRITISRRHQAPRTSFFDVNKNHLP
ncbi:MAG: hypothetical protein AAF936_08490 [Pseudomonadota bacterium]